jgi:hypothetical protein
MLNSLITRICLAAILGLLCVPARPGLAQDKPTPRATGDQAAAKPFKGRLPTYFAQVVTSAQRTEIYSVQSRHAQSLERLRKQLKQLTAERDMEVWNVLTDIQQDEVTSLREAARKRREARALESKGVTRPADGSPAPPSS